jgi:hypothetical protein
MDVGELPPPRLDASDNCSSRTRLAGNPPGRAGQGRPDGPQAPPPSSTRRRRPRLAAVTSMHARRRSCLAGGASLSLPRLSFSTKLNHTGSSAPGSSTEFDQTGSSAPRRSCLARRASPELPRWTSLAGAGSPDLQDPIAFFRDPIAFIFCLHGPDRFLFYTQGRDYVSFWYAGALCKFSTSQLGSPHTTCQTSDTLSMSSLARDTKHIRKSEPNQDGASLYEGRLQFSIGPGYQTHPKYSKKK